MTVENILVEAYKKLHKQEAKILLANLLNKNPLELYNILEETLSTEIVENYFSQVEKLANNYPMQYVMGKVNFYGFEFIVNEDVLIPRFETEELVENTINLSKNLFDYPVKILDIGTGSGIIAITLKKLLPNSEVFAIDISEDALIVAKKNAKLNDVDINFITSDLFDNITDKFDIIISNPPYIATDDEVDAKVLKYEPHQALFANNNGLEIYERITKDINSFVNNRFLISLEHGDKQQKDLVNIVNNNIDYDEIILKKDLQEKDRMIFIIKN